MRLFWCILYCFLYLYIIYLPLKKTKIRLVCQILDLLTFEKVLHIFPFLFLYFSSFGHIFGVVLLASLG